MSLRAKPKKKEDRTGNTILSHWFSNEPGYGWYDIMIYNDVQNDALRCGITSFHCMGFIAGQFCIKRNSELDITHCSPQNRQHIWHVCSISLIHRILNILIFVEYGTGLYGVLWSIVTQLLIPQYTCTIYQTGISDRQESQIGTKNHIDWCTFY